jgi:zinc transport system permease protein
MLLIAISLILISFIFAPLGCFALWKKYVYFGDALSHATMLATSISIILNLPIIFSGIISSVIFSIAIFLFTSSSNISSVISIISSFMLAIALICSYIYPSKINTESLLFGDVLSINYSDIFMLISLLIIIIIFIYKFGDQIILTILHQDIAKIKNINVAFIEFTFLILLSLSIFLTVKIAGALLIVNLLIAPSMIAKFISTTHYKMIIYSTIISIIINLSSFIICLYIDMPLAPIIVINSSIIYISLVFFQCFSFKH